MSVMGILQLLMSWLIPVNVAIKLSRPEPKGGTVSDSTDDSNANREGDRPNVDGDKPVVTLTGVVQKIINPLGAKEPEKVEIAIQEADDLYKEIRIENTLENADGEKLRLKRGAEVDVHIEAPVEAVEKKPVDEAEKKSA